MDACIQGRPDLLPARQPREDSREKQEQNTVSEENLASHTYRRSIQEAHAIRDPYTLHTPHDNSIRWNKWCMYAIWPPKLLQR
jgi:hypothetical protein